MKIIRRPKVLLLFILAICMATAASASGGSLDLQAKYLNKARTEHVRLSISMINGERFEGYIKSFDTESVLVESNGDILLFKNAISSLRSLDASLKLKVD